MIRTRVKLAATLTVVVLALTGFQTGTHGGGKSSSKSGSRSGKSKSSGGGGCSSSKKKNNDYDDDGDYGNSGASTDTPSPSPSPSSSGEASAEVTDCVRPAQPKRKGKPARRADTTATVRITSEESGTRTFRVVVAFLDASSREVDRSDAVVTVDSLGTKTFELAMRNPKAVARVKRCSVDEVREVSQAVPTPAASAS